MVRSLRGRLVAALALLTCLAAGAVAAAAGDDRAAAEAALKDAEGSPRKDVAAELLRRGHAALDRGARLRSSGDEAHAKLADAVARSWAEAARDVTRAAVVEASAAAARNAATDAGAIADRERALLEEAIAQTGRVHAQLEAAEHERKEQPARTSTAAASSDAGVRAPATPKPAPKAASKDGGAP
jgi:hypothetical protein